MAKSHQTFLWLGAAIGLLALPSRAADPVYLESGGAIVMEVESAEIDGDWKRETKLDGFTGDCYYTWRGGDRFNSPGRGILRYRFVLRNSGNFQLRIHNRHDHHDSTLENDCFTRMDEGRWVKTYSQTRGKWTWNSRHEHSHSNKIPAAYELDAGEHVLEISGRSKGFSIDRVHLFREGTSGEDRSRPVSTTRLERMTGKGPYVKLATIHAHIAEGQRLGGALKTLERKSAAKDPQEADEAKRMLAALQSFATASVNDALALRESDPVEALTRLEKLSRTYQGHELGSNARDAASEIKKDPKAKDELRAHAVWLRIAAWKQRIRPVKRSRDLKDPKVRKRNATVIRDMRANCTALIERYATTSAARKAKSLLKQLL